MTQSKVEAEKALDEVNTQVQEKNTTITEHIAEADKLKTQIQTLEASVASSNNDLETLKLEKNKLEEKQQQSNDSGAKYKEEIANLNTESDALKAELQNLKVASASGGKRTESLAAEVEELRGKKESAEGEADRYKTRVAELEAKVDEADLTLLKANQGARAEADKLTAEASDYQAQIAVLEQRLKEADELQSIACGGDDAESRLLQKVSDYEGIARRADAARAQMERELERLQAQLAYFQQKGEGSVQPDDAPAKKKQEPTVAEKINAMKTRKETKIRLKQVKEESLERVGTKAIRGKDALRAKYLKKMYKEANSTPIPLKTNVGVVHLTQQAYVRKVNNTRTAADGSITVEGSENATEALLNLTKKTDAEKFLQQRRGLV